jgi:ABC-type sulfate transport system permease component
LKNRILVSGSVAAPILGAVSSFADTTSFDFSSIATGITSQVTGALPMFATVIGLVVGIPLAWKLVRRIMR